MNLSDSKTINADPATVYAALLDRDVLASCVPGCKEMTGSPEEGFEATVVQKVGPVKATFKGAVELSEMVENESLTLSGAGKGGAAGFAKGGANVRLEADGEQTILHYDVEAKVGGKLA
ncbi:CoxG family protein, partial [Planktotalea frisia]|uniref:CoxG family protein n=1 Tax=Planktotalea frisia TaxID=696762 RepID=UPI0023563608